MNNYIKFSEFSDIYEMLQCDINELVLEQLSKEIILSENYEEAYALYESEAWDKLKNAFKKNPEESIFKKILLYVGGGYGGAYAGSKAGTKLGKKLIKPHVETGDYIEDLLTKNKKGIQRNKFNNYGAAIGGLLIILVLAIYRKYTDTCRADKNTPINWWRCQKEAAQKAKSKLKEHEREALSALNKEEYNEQAIEKLKGRVADKMVLFDEKIAKCDKNIKRIQTDSM